MSFLNRHLLITLIFGLLIGCSTEDKEVTISAIVNDSEGKPLPVYGLQIIDVNKGWLGVPEKSFTGEYGSPAQVTLNNDEPVILKLSAPGYRPTFTFLVPGFNSIALEATLQPGELPEKMNPMVIGNFNSFDSRSGIQMELNDSEIWQATFETEQDTIHYAIYLNTMITPPGNTGDVVINPESRGFETTFFSEIILPESDSDVTVEFDPATVPAGESYSNVEITSPTPDRIKGVAKIFTIMSDEYMDLVFSSISHHRSGEPGMYEHNMEQFLDELDALVAQYNNRDVSSAAVLAKLRFTNEIEVNESEVSELLPVIAPDSPLWIIHPTVLTSALDVTGMDNYENLVHEIAEQSPYPQIRGEALYNLVRYYHDNDKERQWHESFTRLTSNYPEHFRTTQAFGNYAPEIPYADGLPLKHDEFNSLDGSGTINLNELEESYLFIDFWASWCGPCIAAMPKLHELHAEMRDEDFAIVSISIDEKREHVFSFQEEWEMPWYNAYENRHTSDKIRELGIFSIPRYILLGPDRRVLTHNQLELRSGDLPEVIRGYMESE